MLVNDNRFFSYHSYDIVKRKYNNIINKLETFSIEDFYLKFFNFNYDFPNHDLLNIMSLYSYILAIEILIVLCVFFVHSSILDSDVNELITDSYLEDGYVILDDYSSELYFEAYLSLHNNVSLGIGHNVESFLDFFFLVVPTAIIIYILIPSLGLLYNKEFTIDYSLFSFVIDIVGHQ